MEPTRADYIAAAALHRTCSTRGVTIRPTIDCVVAQRCLRDGQALLAKDRDIEQIAERTELKLAAVNQRNSRFASSSKSAGDTHTAKAYQAASHLSAS